MRTYRNLALMMLAAAVVVSGCDEPAAPSGAETPGKSTPAEAAEVIVTDATFKTVVLDSTQPVLVDIWATWCGPCIRAAPTVKALAWEYAGRAKVCKLDSDANPTTARQYVKEGIPLFLVFKNGKVVHQTTGFSSDAHLKSTLKKALDAAMK